jgi:hypothetical protein
MSAPLATDQVCGALEMDGYEKGEKKRKRVR